MRAKRSGAVLDMGVREIRKLLAQEDPEYIQEDLVTLKPLRAGELRWAPSTMTLVRTGRILQACDE
jgi:hypothetical protein